MSKKLLIQILQYVVFLALGVLLFLYAMEGVEWDGFWKDFASGNPIWIVVSVLIGLLAHLLRAIRWVMLMKAAGHSPRLGTTYASLLIGYGFNDLVPRGGEFARCTMLLRSDKVPFSISFGTVVTERVMDVVMLGILVLLTMLLEYDKLAALWTNVNQAAAPAAAQAEPSLIAVIVGWMGFLLKWAIVAAVGAAVLYVLLFWKRFRASDMYGKVTGFAKQMIEALRSIFKMKQPLLFIFYSIAIWACYALMTYLPFLSLESTSHLGFYFACFVLVIGAIGFMFPSPGGTGAYHFAVIQSFLAFNYSEESGQSIALILHTSQFIVTLLVGFLAYIWLERIVRRESRG